MDWSEVMQTMMRLASETGELSADQFTEALPATLTPRDVESLIEALNTKGIWIVD